MEFDLENPLTSFQEHKQDTVTSLFANEFDHMPSTNMFKFNNISLSIRQEAVSYVLQEQLSSSYDAFVPYLAINYIDRFISKQRISQQAEPWIAKLLAVSCFSLAAKIKNADFSKLDEHLAFDEHSIHRMEILILSALNWRMRSITPFSFLNFFVSLFEFDDPSLSQTIKNYASDILFKSQCEIKLLEYNPSIIAASVLLCACHELNLTQFSSFKSAISACEHVNNGNLLKCLDNLQDYMMFRNINEESSVFNSHYSSITLENIESIKRQKPNDFCRFYVSKIQRC